MNSAIKAAAGLLLTLSAALNTAHAAPDITTQTIPFDITAQESYASLSADGRYVAFKIQQKGPSSGYPTTVYIQDLLSGQRVQANLTLAGAPAPGASNCNFPSMSATGRYVVFGCVASLMGGATTGGAGYFVYDKESGSTQMIPDTGDDRPGNNYGSAISADGRFVAFRTMTAGNVSRLYVRDLVNKTTSATNAQSLQSALTRMSISADGRYIAYLGSATLNTAFNVSVYDRVSGVTEAVDVRLDGSRSTASATEVTMSDDGMVVAFMSTDKALAATAPFPNLAGVYVRDRRSGKTELISTVINSSIQYAGISGNGRYVGYTQGNVMSVYDRQTKLTRKIILTSMLAFGSPRFSSDGRYVAFTTSNTALTMQSVTVADLGVAPGVTLSADKLTLTEGGNAGVYTMALTQAPDADVKITAASGAQLSLARGELTFTSANWSTPQAVSVQAVADGITEGNHSAVIVHTVNSADANYGAVQAASVTVSIADGIVPTIVIPATSWTRADMPLTGTAAPGSTVLLTAVNRSTGWLSAASTVADAQGNWNYTLTGYNDGVIDLDVQADGVKSVVRTVTVNLTVVAPPPTFTDVTGYIRTLAASMAYNRSTGKYVGNFVLTNTGSIPLAGPLHLQFDNLTTGITLSNATASHGGAPYITVPAGLAPDESVTIPLVFDNPARGAIGYDAKIFSGIF